MDAAFSIVATGSGPSPVLMLSGLLAVAMVVSLVSALCRYKRCPAGKAMVISGRTPDGRPRVYTGGAVFVWPLIQECRYLDLAPITFRLETPPLLTADQRTAQFAGDVTVAVSQDPALLANAAARLMGLDADRIGQHAGNVILGEINAGILGIASSELESGEFPPPLKETVDRKLSDLGLDLVELNLNRQCPGEDQSPRH